MNILWTITYFTPYVSGLTLYADRITKILNGHKHAVLCNLHNTNLSETDNIGGTTVIRARPLLKLSKGFLSIDWYVKLIKLLKNSDVAVFHLPQAEAGLSAVIAKLTGKKVVCVYHCEIDYPNKIIQKLLEVSNLIALKLATKIVVYTSDYADSSKLLKSETEKIVAIYPPVPELHVDVGVQNKIKKKIPKSDYVLGIAARLAKEKGIEYALEALVQLNKTTNKKWILAIAGPLNPVGEEKYKDKINILVEKQSKNVIILGSLNSLEMGAFYKCLDLLLLPSINSTEAFGMVQVEAMKLGVPVVASDLPGVRVPILKTGFGVLVPIKRTDLLVEAIKKILENRAQMKNMQSLARKEFDQKEVYEKYERLFENLR